MHPQFAFHLIFAGLTLVLVLVQVHAFGSMSKRAFMSYTDSNGNVRSMDAGNLLDESFMMNSDPNPSGGQPNWMSNGNGGASIINKNNDRLDFSEFFKSTFDAEMARNPMDSSRPEQRPSPNTYAPNGLEKITFADGSFIYVPKHSMQVLQQKPTKHSVYYFPRFTKNQMPQSGRPGSSHQSFSGPTGGSGNVVVISGGNGADANRGGADGYVRVEAVDNRPIKVSYQRQQPPV